MTVHVDLQRLVEEYSALPASIKADPFTRGVLSVLDTRLMMMVIQCLQVFQGLDYGLMETACIPWCHPHPTWLNNQNGMHTFDHLITVKHHNIISSNNSAQKVIMVKPHPIYSYSYV